jgi:hypothetical protein
MHPTRLFTLNRQAEGSNPSGPILYYQEYLCLTQVLFLFGKGGKVKVRSKTIKGLDNPLWIQGNLTYSELFTSYFLLLTVFPTWSQVRILVGSY